MSLANKIREFTFWNHIEPGLTSASAQVIIRAGDIHSAMKLSNQYASVCSALGARIMEDRYGVRLVSREGPHAGANATFRFARAASTGPDHPHDELRNRDPLRERVALPAPKGVTPERPSNPRTVFLVACTKSKLPYPAPAADLFCSAWFKKARSYVESQGGRWLILSAKHGVIEPHRVVEPYDVFLHDRPIRERRDWSDAAFLAIRRLVPDANVFVILAGSAYSRFLAERLGQAGMTVELPLAGLRRGEQLAWLKDRT